jgi:hypothetical protein
MFLLPYAPAFSILATCRADKKITTMRPSTLAAVTAAIELLDRDGIVLISVYPGHAEGEAEGLRLDEEL